MSINIKYLFALLLVILVGPACGDDPSLEEMTEEKIVPRQWQIELDSLVQKFVREGESRGVSLDADDLTLKFVDEFSTSDTTSQTCGYGWWNFNRTGQRRVELLDSDHCWHTRTGLEKENFMFHELGHALLSLSHTYERFANGSGASIMCTYSDNNNCSNYRVYHQTNEMRKYYLDELFLGISDTPDWAINENSTSTIFSDSIDNVATGWENFVARDEENASGFELDVTSEHDNTFKLKINVTNSPMEDGRAYFYQYVDLNDLGEQISDCQAVKLKLDYAVLDGLAGEVKVDISLYKNNQSFSRQNVDYEILTSESNGYLESEIYCVPIETDYILIQFGIKPSNMGSITFDNIDLSLWE